MEAARAATTDDLADLAGLAELAVESRLAERGGPDWEERSDRDKWRRAGLASVLEADEERLVVGTFVESVVGFGRCRTEDLQSGRRVGVVEELFVLPDARSVGVGEAMMTLLLEWCVEQGCDAIESIALPGNRAAKNFFERFGLVARAIVVKRSLTE